jgi:hypothetical protein
VSDQELAVAAGSAGGMLALFMVGALCVWAFLPSLEPKHKSHELVITIRQPDRTALKSVVHYVQPEADPELTFTNCVVHKVPK